MYVAATAAHEWLTVIPKGDWRTVEHGSGRRRLTLRRYVVLAVPLYCPGTSQVTRPYYAGYHGRWNVVD